MSVVPTAAPLDTRAVTVSALFAQISLLVTTPLATRLVGQSDFSDYQVALSIAAVMQPLLSGGIEYLLPAVAASKVRTLRSRGYLFLGAGTVIALIAGCGLLLAGNTRLATIVIGSGVVAVIYAYTALDSAYRAQLGLLRLLAARNLTFGSAVILFQVMVIIWWPSFAGLVCAILAARVVSIGVSLLLKRAGVAGSTAEPESSGPLGRAAGLRQNFAWLAGVSVSTIAVQAPVLLLGFHSLDLAGTFALALRIASLPAAVLGAAVSQGFALRLARLVRDGAGGGRIRAMVSAVQRRWLIIGLAGAIVMAVAAPFVTPLVLGAGWGSAGTYIAVLAVPFGLQLVNRIVQPVYPLFGRNGTLVWLQATRLLAVGGATALVLLLVSNPLWAVLAIAVTSGLSFTVSYLITPRLIPESDPAPGALVSSSEHHV